ncbi:MAG: MOSC domain-containing protein [Elusimicrobia bacterium HGW-Elusimicrobia-1]|jgi:MOSC domain-containing protein YiiM|nr:MAG: MOSC domain-containing protein [Elusimicrobia bacterium HGW-Elusimicrobia-1]
MVFTGTVLSVNVAQKKGEKKAPVSSALLKHGGIEGDAHFSSVKEVSFLDWGAAEKLAAGGTGAARIIISPGDFAENITTKGLDLRMARIGARIEIRGGAAETVLFEVTSIGKTCHDGCRIKQTLGDCVMPREGVFAKVVRGGSIKPGDTVELKV